jgi:hypothetical protein
MTVALMFTGSAAAATVVGSNCGANDAELNDSVISLKSPTGVPSAIPSAGVITSWTFSLGLPVGSEVLVSEKLKVFAPTGISGQFTVVGETARVPVGVGSTTSPTRIPVQGGDLLGSSTFVSSGSESESAALFCQTKDPEDELAFIANDPPTGSTVTALKTEAGAQNPIVATVEPDADGDGYGDETQDHCPTDASTHEACPPPKMTPPPPAPSAPIALSDSAAAKKGLVTISLTSSAQATVTVAGTVEIGKGKSVKLSGGTQIVAPGALAKFTVVFPAKLKAALKQLPTSKKLSLVLTATAPGATAKTLTVKVPGQEKAAPRRHKHVS